MQDVTVVAEAPLAVMLAAYTELRTLMDASTSDAELRALTTECRDVYEAYIGVKQSTLRRKRRGGALSECVDDRMLVIERLSPYDPVTRLPRMRAPRTDDERDAARTELLRRALLHTETVVQSSVRVPRECALCLSGEMRPDDRGTESYCVELARFEPRARDQHKCAMTRIEGACCLECMRDTFVAHWQATDQEAHCPLCRVVVAESDVVRVVVTR